MSLDPSLKGAAALTRHRNVLNRAERIARLSGDGKWNENRDSILGIVKVGNRKLALASKTAKKDETAEAAVGGKAAPAGKAAAGKAAPAGKAAAGKAAPAGKAAAGKAAPAGKAAAGKAAPGKK